MDELTEPSRFANGPLSVLGHLHWKVFRLFEEMKKALALCTAQGGTASASLAVDTWGVDFGLLAGDGSILGLPYSYRDGRTQGAMDSFFNRVAKYHYREVIPVGPRETLFVACKGNLTRDATSRGELKAVGINYHRYFH